MNEQEQVEMMGATVAELRAIASKMNIRQLAGAAMSVLSDAQEVRNPEQARRMINRAKFFLADIMDLLPR